MFNLYQSGSITRDMVVAEQLIMCKLAFSLCILKDGVYEHVSAPSFSDLIKEN